jgi:energy-converting hydrogenase Eha subunit E
MTDQDKIAKAVELIRKIQGSSDAEVEKIITEHVGVEVGAFFIRYSRILFSLNPDDIGAISALMLMGYLIRVNEEKEIFGQRETEKPRTALN